MTARKWKRGDTLYWAKLFSYGGRPPVAEVCTVRYHDPAKAIGTHLVIEQGKKWPARAETADLFDDPHLARNRLVDRVELACNEHSYQISQLWDALAGMDRRSIINWKHPAAPESLVITVSTEPKIVPPEIAVRNPLTSLQDAILAKARRNSTEARLVVNAQRAAADDATRRVIVTTEDMPNITAAPPLEGLPLLDAPEKYAVAAGIADVPDPVNPALIGPVPSATNDDGVGQPDRRQTKPRKGKRSR